MRLLERHPGARIEVLAPGYVAPVLHRMAEVAEVLVNPFGHGQLRLGQRLRLGRSLAARGYDLAVVLPNTLKSALVPFFARIPQRTGFVGEGRYGLLNRIHRLDARALPQIAERYAQLAEAPGAPLPRPLPMPRLHSEALTCQATLRSFGLTGNAGPLVAFCPGAEYGPAKRWPESHFAQLARDLAGSGARVLLVGSPKDGAVGARIEHEAGGACRNLCGGTTLDQAMDLLAAADFVVTNDSGLMHVAAALGRPLLALFGSSTPHYTPPLSDRAQVIWRGLQCSPCFKRECPLGHLDCLAGIPPQQVGQSVLAHLRPTAGSNGDAELTSA